MLTQTAVLAAKPKEKAYKLADGDGLYLLIESNGSKLWRFRYQFERKEKMLSLGSFPDVTIAQARTKRDEARKVLAAGVDPARKREQDRITAQINASNTFGVVAAEYLDRLHAEDAAASTMSKNTWLLEDLAAPPAKRPIAEITSAELLQLLQRIEKSGRRDTAHRLRGMLGNTDEIRRKSSLLRIYGPSKKLIMNFAVLASWASTAVTGFLATKPGSSIAT